ncbi:MAG: acetolactate synthase small subunit [bacterium]
MSRITVVVKGDDKTLEQVRKQFEKIITVVSVQDVSRYDFVERDLLLLRVKATTSTRQDVLSLINIFRGKVVDVTPNELMVELAGQEKKIQAFIEAISAFGIVEMARTGRIALIRGSKPDSIESAEALPSDQPMVVGHSSL